MRVYASFVSLGKFGKGREHMKIFNWRYLITITLLSVIIIIGILTNRRGSEPVAAQNKTEISVKLQTIKESPIRDFSEYVAHIESRQSVTLKPQTAGRVTKINYRSGEKVAAGTLIVQIDAQEQVAAVNSSLASIAAAHTDITTTQASLQVLKAEEIRRRSDLKLSETELTRYQMLLSEGVVSHEEIDRRQNNVNVARANVEAILAQIAMQQAVIQRAEDALKQAQANSAEREVQLRYTQVVAPFNGQIGDIPVRVGDYVTNQSDLFSLTENNSLYVNVNIPLERAASLRRDLPMEVLGSNGEVIGQAHISFIAPNADASTQSVLVKAEIANDGERLRADQFVRARIVWAEKSGLLIPITSVTRIAGQDFVFIAKQGKDGLIIQQQAVKLGIIIGNNYQVLSGINAGDRIATTGLLKLSDGAAINEEK